MIKSFCTYLSCALLFMQLATNANSQAILPDYSESGRKLPPGVPRVVDTNGNVVYVRSQFTTDLYRTEAYKLVLQEANKVAKELQLPEKLPIVQSNVIESFISPFGFAYAYKAIGNVTTENYVYYVSRDNKFNHLCVADYDQTCIRYEKKLLSLNLMDTNMAYRLATQWLSAVSMDVVGLNRDCQVKIQASEFWNRSAAGSKSTKPKFVPIYDVWWLLPRNRTEGGDAAYVQLFAPSKQLLQLSVDDPKYILRKPLVFTNLASLFPGVATVHTNHPFKPKIIPLPPN